jgi:hypothetical protein
LLERQHIIFIAVAGAALGALVIVGLFFNPLQTKGDDSNSVTKARIGQEVHIRYSKSVIAQIQNLPNKNNVTLQVSSELRNTNLAGLRGEIRYSDMVITYFQDGKEEIIKDDVFPTVEYRFAPDPGNKTTYSYENVRFTANADEPQLVVSIIPLKAAEVGERYTVKLIMDGGGPVKYAIAEKVIEIVA